MNLMNFERGLHYSSDARGHFSKSLEQKARRIVRGLENEPWHSSPSTSLEHAIAFTLDKIDGTKRLHESLEQSLTRSECSIGTDLMNLTPRAPKYAGYEIDPRTKVLNRKLHERLRSRKQGIEQERRRLAITKAESLMALQTELLSLRLPTWAMHL